MLALKYDMMCFVTTMLIFFPKII